MTAALEGGEWSAARPGRTLPPGKTRYPFYRRLGGPQGRSGRAENLVPTGIRSRTVRPVVSRCTDWATRPTTKSGTFKYLLLQSHHDEQWCALVAEMRTTFARRNLKKIKKKKGVALRFGAHQMFIRELLGNRVFKVINYFGITLQHV